MVRYHTGGPLAEPPLTGLNPFAGRHDAALRAGLLSASGGLAVPAREVTPAEKVAVPIGATGIIVGTTASGHPLLVDLRDPTELATVTISGEFALLVQVVLRAAATGYQVLVCTERPQRWQPVTGAGLQVVGAAGLAEQLPASPYPYVIVYDGVGGPGAGGGGGHGAHGRQTLGQRRRYSYRAGERRSGGDPHMGVSISATRQPRL